MAQMTIRLDEELAYQVKTYADGMGRSVNSWVIAVLRTVIDPEFADSAAERTRGRLARAGLLAPTSPRPALAPPDAARLKTARRAAGAGAPLAEIVSDERG